jgi:RES domain/TIR domain
MAGKIFLSYRREDTAWPALALFGRLEHSFPSELFMDVEGGIKPGEDFPKAIEAQVSDCDAMLVLIGSNWLTATDGIGRRRLNDPRDFVRLEVESAFRLRKHVIPVLVQGTEMPSEKALPKSLKPLARRNAIGLTYQHFAAEVQGLITALKSALDKAEAARRQAAAEAARRQAAAEAAAAEAQRAAERAKADEIDRERWSREIIKSFLVSSKTWGLSKEEAATLMGVSLRDLDRIERGDHPGLSRDPTRRISAIVDIINDIIEFLGADSTVKGWIRKPIPFLNDKSPLDWMVDGGIQRTLEGAPPPMLQVALPETLEGMPTVRANFRRTVRLVSTARLRPTVLKGLVSAEDAAALAEIEGATSQRLLAEQHGAEGIGRDEFLHGVPYASFVNAAFAYWKPREPNRFNAMRGAWYAALEVKTVMREIVYHMNDFLQRSGSLRGVVEYTEMFADISGEFVDLRQTPDHPSLNPDPAIGYPAGNALADAARARGLNGIVAPSVRHLSGTQVIALRPAAMGSVARGSVYRFEWSGNPEPKITQISN